MSRSAGTCNTMGTASTMACMAEALGTSLPHNAAIPAVDARRYVLAHMSGSRIVEMVREDLTLSKILTRAGVRERHPRQRRDRRVHQRRDPPEGHRRPHRRAARTRRLDPHRPRHPHARGPACPPGRFLMEEFYYAGGLPAVMRRLGEHGLLPHTDALTVNGQTLWDNVREAPELRRRGDPPARQAADRTTAASASCAATSRRAAPCSSPRPPRPS